MLIGICGSICSGKSTVAQYLVDHHGFQRLYIKPSDQPNGTDQPFSKTEDQTTIAERTNGSEKPAPNGLPVLSKRRTLTFSSSDDLLDFATKRWRDRWVTTSLQTEAELDAFTRRPFFLLVAVDAPLTLRWKRFVARESKQKGKYRPPTHDGESPQPSTTLETFASSSDAHLYDPVTGHLPLMSRASVRLLNTSPDLAHLYATLGKVDLLDSDRLRPSWDTYFMALASLAARRSNCMKRRVGCVLVHGNRVISTGYNGTPRGLVNCGEGGCGRCNGGLGAGVGLATCLCIHAEENALLEAGRERIREGATLYCDTCPCLTCSIKIVQVGIGEVVYSQGYSMDGETAAVFREAGARLRQFVPPANGLIHLEKMELY